MMKIASNVHYTGSLPVEAPHKNGQSSVFAPSRKVVSWHDLSRKINITLKAMDWGSL
jgi:hypothetical protein